MKHFRYVAIDKKGKSVKGFIDALNKQEVHASLERIGLYPVSIEEASVSKLNLRGFNLSFGRIREEELIIFTEQLATLVASGLSITEALQGLSEQIENKFFQSIITGIKIDIEKGTSLSNAFKKYRKVFPEIYISLLSVGEATGTLDKVLRGVANYLERDIDIRRKINSAFAYPKFVVTVVISVVIFLLGFILPKFVSIYTQAGEVLPTPTRILLQVSNFLKHRWELLVIAVVLIYIAYRIFYSTKFGRLLIDGYKLKIPVFGKISKFGALSRFLHSCALVLGSGINVVEAIEIASKVSGNAYIISELKTVQEEIGKGSNISAAMRERKFFPRIMVQMVSVGERSGSLDNVLEKLGILWDRDLDHAIKNLAAKIEPTLIIILGVIVGFIGLAMYLPMFSLPATYKKTF